MIDERNLRVLAETTTTIAIMGLNTALLMSDFADSYRFRAAYVAGTGKRVLAALENFKQGVMAS